MILFIDNSPNMFGFDVMSKLCDAIVYLKIKMTNVTIYSACCSRPRKSSESDDRVAQKDGGPPDPRA